MIRDVYGLIQYVGDSRGRFVGWRGSRGACLSRGRAGGCPYLVVSLHDGAVVAVGGGVVASGFVRSSIVYFLRGL